MPTKQYIVHGRGQCGDADTLAEARTIAATTPGGVVYVQVERLIALDNELAAAMAALEALSGSPKDMLDFCQAHGLEFMKPEPVADTWRKSIARFALEGK